MFDKLVWWSTGLWAGACYSSREIRWTQLQLSAGVTRVAGAGGVRGCAARPAALSTRWTLLITCPILWMQTLSLSLSSRRRCLNVWTYSANPTRSTLTGYLGTTLVLWTINNILNYIHETILNAVECNNLHSRLISNISLILRIA